MTMLPQCVCNRFCYSFPFALKNVFLICEMNLKCKRFRLSFKAVANTRSRKRSVKTETHKRVVKKKLIERGKAHTTRKGRTIADKIFKPQTICDCKNSCALHIDDLRQREIFDHYYGSSTWSSKTHFIRTNVRRDACKHKRFESNPICPLKSRNYSTEFTLSSTNGSRHKVCRKFFMNLLQVSAKRIQHALCSELKNPNAIDLRGKTSSKNKTNARDMQFLKDFIGRFPRYESHYRRSHTDKMYLAPHLTIAKMYREYRLVCEFQGRVCLSEFIFRRTFNYDFNLGFKSRKTDTCKTCDELNVLKTTEEVSTRKQKHDDLVSKTKRTFSNDILMCAESAEKLQCLTFDLQKTLETPSLSTSVAYYKRQLWTYNLCIYDEVHKIGYMYIWSENIASRGAQEIGSALVYHFMHYLPLCTNHIILYSDSCGGQNRNIKLTLMMKKFLCDNGKISKIEQKYFIPGHSYNSCDRCFGLIDRQKKSTENIFCPKHWVNLIAQAKKSEPKFIVTELSAKDFYSCSEQEKLIINRKKNEDGEKINWFTIRRIMNNACEPFIIELDIDGESNTKRINISKKDVTVDDFLSSEMRQLSTRTITKKKYDDLISLLRFIPNEYHSFYKELKYKDDDKIDDFGLASGDSDDENDEK